MSSTTLAPESARKDRIKLNAIAAATILNKHGVKLIRRGWGLLAQSAIKDMLTVEPNLKLKIDNSYHLLHIKVEFPDHVSSADRDQIQLWNSGAREMSASTCHNCGDRVSREPFSNDIPECETCKKSGLGFLGWAIIALAIAVVALVVWVLVQLVIWVFGLITGTVSGIGDLIGTFTSWFAGPHSVSDGTVMGTSTILVLAGLYLVITLITFAIISFMSETGIGWKIFWSILSPVVIIPLILWAAWRMGPFGTMR